MRCAGIDLSWTGRRPSGFALVESDGRVATWTAVAGPGDAAAWLGSLEPPVVAGIDAPLSAEPGRTAEAELARGLGRSGVMAYQVGGDFLERKGFTAGPALGGLLRAAGWELAPSPGRAAGPRVAFETFPRALTVTVMGAARPPAYKRGTLAGRQAGLAEYANLLRSALGRRGLELDIEPPAVTAGSCATGRALKELEDRLDAAACALAAWVAAYEGLQPGDLFGSAAGGLIAVPGAAATSARERTSP
ncbi:DUF429 domain-containing protein [Tepidiforma sp.]|uniref:DUF429 domain-containing protein n=1 Tax=Tepidiforma sp. TaxID=2682230 RepID=UPI0026193A25|nr:DUF429 domain-containing protein [Tepidiforma sp.]MCX7616879.1 DUF429 domain-containing protein [Tepidiforma sp.]